VFELGRHRLLCGDSTDPAVVEQLMQGQPAALVVTDPPYGVVYVGKSEDLAADHR
jgi:DNA modification methylase